MSLETNKIVGAVLLGGIVTLGSSILAEKLVHPRPAHLSVAVAEAPAAAPAATSPQPEAIEPVSGLLAAADVGAGEALAKKCATCHTFDKGAAAKVGPNLWGIIGAPHAHMEGFAYTDAMKKLHDKPWTYEELNAFIDHPQKTIPGTKMTFPGLAKAQERANVIGWLRTKSDSPPPLPSEAEIKAASEAAKPAAPAAAPAAPKPTQTAAATPATASDQTAGATAPATAQAGGDADFVGLLKAADPANGKKIAAKCSICHTFDKGAAAKVGPNLWDVVGGPHAHMEGFAYSDAMKALHDQTWTFEALNTFITDPKAAVPGTKMAFAGIKKAEDRAAVIAFLRSLSDNPKPLPEGASGAATPAAQPTQQAAAAPQQASDAQPAPAPAPAPAAAAPAPAPAPAAEQPAAAAPAAEQGTATTTAEPAAAPAAESTAAAPAPAAESTAAPAPTPTQVAGGETQQPQATTGDTAAPATTGEAPAAGDGDFIAALKAADPAAGAKVAAKCKICHSLEKDAANKVGPNLWDIVGAPHAHKDDFKYSEGMLALHDKPWTFEELNVFLTSPKDHIPGTKMAFAGLKKLEDRAAVIAYLHTLSDSPKPLP
jgi:cytochrome c